MSSLEQNSIHQGYNYQGFKLLSLRLTDFTFFGTIKYDFLDDTDSQDKIYSTVIIGPNGTRKSLLFNLIIYIFKSIDDLKRNNKIDYTTLNNSGDLAKIPDNKNYIKGDYHLIYSYGNEVFEIIRMHSFIDNKSNSFGYSFLRDGKKSEVSLFPLPEAIVGNSTTITDRFPIYKEGEFDVFKYLGIRNTPQSASTKSYIRKTIDFVANMSYSEAFLNGLNLILREFIGQDATINISYKTVNYKRFYDGNLTVNQLKLFFDDIEGRYIERSKTPPFKLNYFKSLLKDSKILDDAIKFANFLSSSGDLNKLPGMSSRQLKFNIADENDLLKLKQFSSNINVLYSLGLLYDPKIEISKSDNEYSLETSSSGEHNLITSLIGLMATIKPNCLILIDEPEISLHANWQMKYVSFLKLLFRNEDYRTSHIIIASHSHFIVSDLEQNSSKVIGLNRGIRDIEVVSFSSSLNTFGWSAEDILYNIFNVRSSLNYYLQADLTELLGIISNGINDIDKVERILAKLNQLPKRENDPLQEIILEATNYLNSIR